MGNKNTVVKNNCIDELNNINENDLDISNIDKLKVKAIKDMNSEIKEIENQKSDRIIYKLLSIKFMCTKFNLIIG